MSCSLTILSRCSIVFFMSSLIQGKSLFSSSFILLSNPFVLLLILACLQSSHAREFRPYVLTEPYVKVSLHTAPHVNRSLKCINHFMDKSEEHTSELQSRENHVCRLLLEKKKSE